MVGIVGNVSQSQVDFLCQGLAVWGPPRPNSRECCPSLPGTPKHGGGGSAPTFSPLAPFSPYRNREAREKHCQVTLEDKALASSPGQGRPPAELICSSTCFAQDGLWVSSGGTESCLRRMTPYPSPVWVSPIHVQKPLPKVSGRRPLPAACPPLRWRGRGLNGG